MTDTCRYELLQIGQRSNARLIQVEQGAMPNTKKSRSSAGSGRRRSKRKYFPPKAAAEVAVEAEEPAATPSQGASARKLKNNYCPLWLEQTDSEASQTSTPDSSDREEESDDDADLACHGNRIVDLNCLQELLHVSVICRACQGGRVIISESNRVGLACNVILRCNNDDCTFEITGPVSSKEKRFHDVNRRSVLAMRHIGYGHAALRKFCGIMNLPPPPPPPPPVTEHSFLKQQKAVAMAVTFMAQCSMQAAAKEVKLLHPDGNIPSALMAHG